MAFGMALIAPPTYRRPSGRVYWMCCSPPEAGDKTQGIGLHPCRDVAQCDGAAGTPALRGTGAVRAQGLLSPPACPSSRAESVSPSCWGEALPQAPSRRHSSKPSLSPAAHAGQLRCPLRRCCCWHRNLEEMAGLTAAVPSASQPHGGPECSVPDPCSSALCRPCGMGTQLGSARPCLLGKRPPGSLGGLSGTAMCVAEPRAPRGLGGLRPWSVRGVVGRWEWVQGRAAGMRHTGTLFGQGGRKSGR